MMIPILLTRNSDVNGSVVQFASFIMAIIGLVVSTLLKLFPVWVLGAVIVIGGIIISILWLKGRNSE